MVVAKNASCTIDGATVTGSVKAQGKVQELEIRGSEVRGEISLFQVRSGDRTSPTLLTLTDTSFGGLKVLESKLNAQISGGNDESAPMIFQGSRGLVVLSATNESAWQAAGDLLVTEHQGVVEVLGTPGQQVLLGDVLVAKHRGAVSLFEATIDSDVTVTEVGSGNVSLRDLTTKGDVEVKDIRGGIEIARNDFGREDVVVSLVTGAVTINDNSNFGIQVSEVSGSVGFTGNAGSDFSFTKNQGGVSISTSAGESLTCADNRPAAEWDGNGFSPSSVDGCRRVP